MVMLSPDAYGAVNCVGIVIVTVPVPIAKLLIEIGSVFE